MPPLAGFSDNAFKNRDDVSTATLSLLHALVKYQSPDGARIRIPVSTAAHFDETAAQLEGYARPLWAVAALVEASGDDVQDQSLKTLVDPFVQGLANGADPEHPEYWGPLHGTDQRMVEMEIISFALLAAPGTFFDSQKPDAKANIVAWLRSINDYRIDPTNWIWFRVMTNMALIKTCGVPRNELWSEVEKDLQHLDTFYLDDAWSSDGIWNDGRRQADYYSGSFAIQFSQLLYVKFANELDPERCESYRQRARKYAEEFVLYFDRNGAAIPFGRSLTYRFAFAGFWAAAAYAGVDLPAPLDEPGVVKGLLLRHLRWWADKHDIFNLDGTLNIGFTYPNMYMCEDYNSPQSVYWSMKSLISLALSASHSFWTAEEKELPKGYIPLAKAVKAPHQILCNTGRHHFMLSSGQFCPWPLKATEAKYGKFAYSSAFGFSVPTNGTLLAQMAPDNALAFSTDDGETWRTRWKTQEPKWTTAKVVSDSAETTIDALRGKWRPFKTVNLEVDTILIPPMGRWRDWHVRIHRVTWARDSFPRAIDVVKAAEGGFAIPGRSSNDGRPLPLYTDHKAFDKDLSTKDDEAILEAVLETQNGCCVFSSSGASGIRKLDLDFTATGVRSRGALLKPDSNTNLMAQRTVIPTVESEINVHQRQDVCGEYMMAVAVFATTSTQRDVLDKWEDAPVVCVAGHRDRSKQKDCIEVPTW